MLYKEVTERDYLLLQGRSLLTMLRYRSIPVEALHDSCDMTRSVLLEPAGKLPWATVSELP